MVRYIELGTLIAEIERLKKSHDNWSCMGKCFHKEYENLLSFLDTLEVKEVDLEKEIDNAFLENKCNITDNVSLVEFVRIVKHFFELGMQVSNKTQKGK